MFDGMINDRPRLIVITGHLRSDYHPRDVLSHLRRRAHQGLPRRERLRIERNEVEGAANQKRHGRQRLGIEPELRPGIPRSVGSMWIDCVPVVGETRPAVTRILNSL